MLSELTLKIERIQNPKHFSTDSKIQETELERLRREYSVIFFSLFKMEVFYYFLNRNFGFYLLIIRSFFF